MSEIVFVADSAGREVELLEPHIVAGRLAVVSDAVVWEVAGKRWHDTLARAGDVIAITLGNRPVATNELVLQVQQKAAEATALVAVGSGTINDICKAAAAAMGIPYVICATAPSMNGYVSATASLTFGKEKRSVKAVAPAALIADMAVIGKAPRRLIHAGLGDMLCRSTVQADWLLSHLLLGTPYDAHLFDSICDMEAEMLNETARLREKDPAILELLMRMLIASGEAMRQAGSSAPASQGEHMIVHMMEMLYGEQLYDQFHGEQVAVTTLTMSQLQDKLLIKPPVIRGNGRTSERFEKVFGRQLGPQLYNEYQSKVLTDEQVEQATTRVADDWPAIAEQIRSVMVPHHKLDFALRRAHCPLVHSDLRWHKDRYEHAVTNAYLSRGRFTFLDIAAMDAGMRYWFA